MRLIGYLLLAGVCIGNTAILVYTLNWIYGHALPRPLLKTIRKIYGLVVLAIPAFIVYRWGWDLSEMLVAPPSGIVDALAAGYIGCCWLIGLVIVPAVALYRLLRRPPRVLESNHTRTMYLEKEIGYRPIGRGKHRHLGLLPGNQVFHVDFSERTLHCPRLPAAWDGLTILHLSDLHLCGSPDLIFYKRVMDLCGAWQQPELIAVTGDFVDTEYHHRWIAPVLGRLRCSVAAFAVLGNHDLWNEPTLVRRRLRRLRVHVLGNAWEEIEVRGEPLVVVGNEGPWFGPAPDLSACPQGPFRLCLSHTPDNMPWARRHDIDLMLAGHNHGGQVRFPLIGSVLIPSRYSRRYDCGVFHEPPTILHVSRGLGGEHPLRYFCRPEVTLLVLRRSPEPRDLSAAAAAR